MSVYQLREGFDPRRVKNVVGAHGRPEIVLIEPGQAFRCTDDLSAKRAYDVLEGAALASAKIKAPRPTVAALRAMSFKDARAAISTITGGKVSAKSTASLIEKYEAWLAANPEG